jgi:hypothetical protein
MATKDDEVPNVENLELMGITHKADQNQLGTFWNRVARI